MAYPEVLWPAIEKFYKDIQEHCGLQVNRSKTKVYSPNGNYVGKPQEFAIGSVSAIMPNHLNGEPTEITAEGLTIWGVATSQDDDFIRANLAAKTNEVFSNINNITNSLNSLSPDVALTVLRLSLQAWMGKSQLPAIFTNRKKSIVVVFHDSGHGAVDPASAWHQIWI